MTSGAGADTTDRAGGTETDTRTCGGRYKLEICGWRTIRHLTMSLRTLFASTEFNTHHDPRGGNLCTLPLAFLPPVLDLLSEEDFLVFKPLFPGEIFYSLHLSCTCTEPSRILSPYPPSHPLISSLFPTSRQPPSHIFPPLLSNLPSHSQPPSFTPSQPFPFPLLFSPNPSRTCRTYLP